MAKGWAKISAPERTVWVGQVPDGITYQDLLVLAQKVGNAKWAQVLSKGTAAIGFATAEDAATAAVALDGAQIGTGSIVTDKWAAGEKKTSSKGGWSKGGGGSWGKGGSWGGKGDSWGGSWGGKGVAGVAKTQYAKPWSTPSSGQDWWDSLVSGWKGGSKGSWDASSSWGGSGKGGWKGGKGGKGKGGSSFGDPAKLVWIGQVPEGATFKELLDLGKQVGTAKWAEVKRGNTGVIAFATAEEATAAIGALNGFQLGVGQIIADAWASKTSA